MSRFVEPATERLRIRIESEQDRVRLVQLLRRVDDVQWLRDVAEALVGVCAIAVRNKQTLRGQRIDVHLPAGSIKATTSAIVRRVTPAVSPPVAGVVEGRAS